MSTLTEEVIYTVCPACSAKGSSCTHIAPNSSFGTWYCESCGEGYNGKRDEDGIFHIERTYEKKYDLLVALLHSSGILILTKGMQFTGSEELLQIDHDHLKYFYEEHTCPTNFLRTEAIIDILRKDEDPHGLFTYLGAVEYFDTTNMPLDEIYKRLKIEVQLTCGNPDHHDDKIENRTLVATNQGWVCPGCSYTQDWAHDFMLTFGRNNL